MGNLFLALAQGFISGPGGDALCLHGECGPIVMQGYTRTGTYACVDTVPASQERLSISLSFFHVEEAMKKLSLAVAVLALLGATAMAGPNGQPSNNETLPK